MGTVRKVLQSPVAAFLFISSLVFFLIIGLRSTGYLESLELAAYDWYIRLTLEDSGTAKRIVLITISERDIRNQGRWPLADGTMAEVISILTRCKPRAIGLDIFRDISVPPGSEKLNLALNSNRHVIGVMKFGEDGVPAHPVLRDTDQVGFNDIVVDPGGTVRRALLFMDNGKTVFCSFALRLALLYLQKEGIVLQSDPSSPQCLRLGQTTIRPFEPNDGGYVRADARGYQFLINFKDPVSVFKYISLTELLSGKVDVDIIKDRIVLIGVNAQSVTDFFYTPYSRGFQVNQQTPGLVVHAWIANELLGIALDGNSPTNTLNEKIEVFWILLWCMMGGLVGLWVRSPLRFSMWGTGGLFILAFAVYLAFLYRWWIPLVPPAISWVLSSTVVTAFMSNHERRQRTILMQLFSRHVSPEVAESIWRQRDQFSDKGRPQSKKLEVTVFFSDLQGFTSVSESMEPPSLIDWLNTYMEPVAQQVIEHGGVIDDYAGDGVKANFGVPLPRNTEVEIRQDAVNAVNCALAIEKEMERLNVVGQAQNLPAVRLRIGIYSGPAVAGVVGTSQRLKYTTVGDTVNVAARLENYDKDLAKESLCRILIGESTLHYLDNRFRTQFISQVKLKGKTEQINIYRVLGKSVNKLLNESQEVKK